MARPQATSSGVEAKRVEPAGNGVAHDRVAGIQRARLLAAMAEVAAERGLADATVARVVARAGVSRRTFYELFDDRESCFLAALDDAIARASDCVVPAYESGDSWAERVRLALTALLSFLDAERGVGQLLIFGSLWAGPMAIERRRRVLAQMITLVELGRGEGRAANGLPPLTAEGIVGAVFSIVHARMLEARPLVELVNPLMGMIVLPYRGAAAARKELERPVPVAREKRRATRPDPLQNLGMRLTYRTVRVLTAVASNPGSSNRTVADVAGISDQGQMSKLLGRLQSFGLVENGGAGASSGGPNAWALTAKGREVHGAIDIQPANA
jgi:AcrR family transcriptional regulator